MRAVGHRSPGAETPPLSGSSCCPLPSSSPALRVPAPSSWAQARPNLAGTRGGEERRGEVRRGDPREEGKGGRQQSLSSHQVPGCGHHALWMSGAGCRFLWGWGMV